MDKVINRSSIFVVECDNCEYNRFFHEMENAEIYKKALNKYLSTLDERFSEWYNSVEIRENGAQIVVVCNMCLAFPLCCCRGGKLIN